ncbi:MAG: 3-dehydroquinate dehydratase [Clostridia bacterium]|nr:3-dehydroquinate dehydratase [Clostridia bacterium]
MKICIINGPNINFLGIREPDIYGRETYSDLIEKIKKHCESIGVQADFFQSNCEGAIIDKIQSCYASADAIVINPAGYTHTSVSIADALKAVGLPCAEVHISDVSRREAFRQISYVRDICVFNIIGHGTDGYNEAIDLLKKHIEGGK